MSKGEVRIHLTRIVKGKEITYCGPSVEKVLDQGDGVTACSYRCTCPLCIEELDEEI